MKKLLSFVIVLAMVLGMTVPVSASISPSGTVNTMLNVGEDFASNKIVTNTGARFQVDGYIGAVGGKADTDTSVKVTGLDDPDSDNNSWYYQAPSDVDCKEGYVVMSVDLFAEDGISAFYFGARQNTSICPWIYFTDEMTNRWVNITTVFDVENITSSTYLDGNIISTEYNPGNFRGYNGSDTTQVSGTVRYILTGEIGGVSYIDNFKLYTCIEEPVVSDVFGLEGHLYDKYVEVPEGFSFAEAFTLSDSSASVAIYADRTYATELDTSDELLNNSYIVITRDGEMRTYNVKVDDGTYVYDSVNNGQFSFVNGVVEYETTMGLFGKKSDDNSAKITKSDSLLAFSEYTWLADDFSGYIRADFNIEAGNVTSLSIGTDSNAPISDKLTLNANQWNRVSVIYDTNSYNANTGLGVAATYVNGVMQSEIETPFHNLRHLRIMLEGETDSYAYVDDFTMTHFDNRVGVICDAAVPSNAGIMNGTAYFTLGMKVADIESDIAGTTVRVYSDAEFTTLLSAEDTLEQGNYVVMETIDMVYSYYPVALEDAEELFNISNLEQLSQNSLTFTRGDVESVYGYGGKAEDDESIKVTLNKIGANNETDAYNSYTWTSSGKRYMVAEVNVFPTGNATTAGFVMNGHGALGGAIALEANRWNKLVMIYDTQNPGTTSTYLNGEFKVSTKTEFVSGKQIRFRLVCSAVKDVMYMDDYRIYESDAGAVITMPDMSLYYDVAADGSIKLSGSISVDEMKSGELTLRAYTDDTYTTSVLDVENLEDGNVVVAEDVYNSLSYYTVATDVTKNILAYSYDGDMTGMAGYGYSGAIPGVCGKSADDMVAEYTRVGTKTDIFTEFAYSEPADSGYLVFEITAYLDDEVTIMQLGTGQHTVFGSKLEFTAGTDYRVNQWNKCMLIYNCATRHCDIYINGVKVDEGTAPSKFLDTSNLIRFIVYSDTDSHKVYVDDVVIYETNVYPKAGKPAQVSANMRYVLYDYSLFMTSATEYADLSTLFSVDDSTVVRFLDENNNIIEVSNGDTLPKDAVYMTLYTGNANYTAYKVRVTDYYNGVVYGPAYDEETGNATSGTLKVAVPVENLSKECVVAVAAYTDDEALEDVWLYKADASSMYVSCDIPVDASKYARIGVMVVDNMDTITPYSPAINVPVK